jgi:predicted TIM-barrel fold metal-dependent hydrolase
LKAKYFDCHFHIIDKNFPVVPNQGFMPDAFTSEDYLERLNAVDLCGGAVVSGSFQAFDQTYLLHALKVLGPSFVGVTQVPQSVSDQELRELNNAGVRAVRFNVKRVPTLLKLAEKGVRVKATGFGRVEFDVRSALTDLYAANPRSLMFGTDLPSTRAPRPYLDDDCTLVLETLGEEKAANVFSKNAIEFYRPKKIG